jgi:hypothetical protein
VRVFSLLLACCLSPQTPGPSTVVHGTVSLAANAPPAASLDSTTAAVLGTFDISFDRPPHPSTPRTTLLNATPAAMSTATANGDAGLKGAAASNKQQFKPSAGGKALDGARKQAGSPVDGQNRSVAPPPSNAPRVQVYA